MNIKTKAWRDFRNGPLYWYLGQSASNSQIFHAGYRAGWEHQAKKIALYESFLAARISHQSLVSSLKELNDLQKS